MAFIGSFLQYIIVLIILAALGVAGMFLGRSLRIKKDAKTAESSGDTNE